MEQLNPSSLQLRSLAILTGLASLPITCHQFALEIAAKGALLARVTYLGTKSQDCSSLVPSTGIEDCTAVLPGQVAVDRQDISGRPSTSSLFMRYLAMPCGVPGYPA